MPCPSTSIVLYCSGEYLIIKISLKISPVVVFTAGIKTAFLSALMVEPIAFSSEIPSSVAIVRFPLSSEYIQPCAVVPSSFVISPT
jgi:hypothetical protein